MVQQHKDLLQGGLRYNNTFNTIEGLEPAGSVSLGGIYDTDRDTYLDLLQITHIILLQVDKLIIRSTEHFLNQEVLVVITNLVLTEMLFLMTHKTAQVY